jgi:hypothetical protein
LLYLKLEMNMLFFHNQSTIAIKSIRGELASSLYLIYTAREGCGVIFTLCNNGAAHHPVCRWNEVAVSARKLMRANSLLPFAFPSVLDTAWN